MLGHSFGSISNPTPLATDGNKTVEVDFLVQRFLVDNVPNLLPTGLGIKTQCDNNLGRYAQLRVMVDGRPGGTALLA